MILPTVDFVGPIPVAFPNSSLDVGFWNLNAFLETNRDSCLHLGGIHGGTGTVLFERDGVVSPPKSPPPAL